MDQVEEFRTRLSRISLMLLPWDPFGDDYSRKKFWEITIREIFSGDKDSVKLVAITATGDNHDVIFFLQKRLEEMTKKITSQNVLLTESDVFRTVHLIVATKMILARCEDSVTKPAISRWEILAAWISSVLPLKG